MQAIPQNARTTRESPLFVSGAGFKSSQMDRDTALLSRYTRVEPRHIPPFFWCSPMRLAASSAVLERIATVANSWVAPMLVLGLVHAALTLWHSRRQVLVYDCIPKFSLPLSPPCSDGIFTIPNNQTHPWPHGDYSGTSPVDSNAEVAKGMCRRVVPLFSIAAHHIQSVLLLEILNPVSSFRLVKHGAWIILRPPPNFVLQEIRRHEDCPEAAPYYGGGSRGTCFQCREALQCSSRQCTDDKQPVPSLPTVPNLNTSYVGQTSGTPKCRNPLAGRNVGNVTFFHLTVKWNSQTKCRQTADCQDPGLEFCDQLVTGEVMKWKAYVKAAAVNAHA
ncbi:hypothetical protein FB451DRAFT_1173562 [Mycena latifolia]|nr:hypothetical protein FB451DRAFT_1173562 [Mycena latifolia]